MRPPRSEAEPSDAIPPMSRLVVALVRGIHGLRGAVRVEVLTDRPEERFAPGRVLHREGSDEPLTIGWSAPVADGPGWRLRFREAPDRTAVEPLRGAYLESHVRPGEGLGRGEYYWHEVIGTPVLDIDGRPLGTVRDVYRAGGAEVFVVSGGTVGEFDLSAVRAFIRVFAPRRGEIVIDAAALDLHPPAPDRVAGPTTVAPPEPPSAPVEPPE